MKLSEAILLGLPEIRFINDDWIDFNADGKCSGCLVGAALYAQGYRESYDAIETLFKYWPWIQTWNSLDSKCPVCEATGNQFVVFWDFLTHLANHYEKHQISKERIADFVRSIEPAEEEAPAAAPILEPAEIGAKTR